MSHEQTNRLFLTNNYSIVSKYSAVKLEYFNDDILKEFIESHLGSKTWRRTPLVNRGYAARLLAVDWVVKRSITTDSVDCFLVLGAGYDTSAYRYANSCCWIELDLPQVVEVKSSFIKDRNILKDEDLIQVEPGIFSSTSSKYHLVTCDLRNIVNLKNILQLILNRMEEHSLKPRNFAIINEVCLCYIDTNEIKKLLEAVITSIRNSANKIQYIGYEQVKPEKESQFSSVMLDHFNSLGHPLKHYPTAEQIHQLLINHLRFNEVKIESMYQLFHNYLHDERNKLKGFREEPFDEFEEMDLYLSHYALVTGSLIINNTPSINSNISTASGESLDIAQNIYKNIGLIKSDVYRYGHSSCLLSDRCILASGGFGMSLPTPDRFSNNNDQKHKRLSDCFSFLNSQDNILDVIQPIDVEDVMSNSINLNRIHGQVCELSENLLFFNGGRQGPIKHSSGNVPFITVLDGTQLAIRHKFDFEATKSTIRWRHRLVKVNQDEVLQIGGVTIPSSTNHELENHHVTKWNFSADKLGFQQYSTKHMLSRHSFGIDLRDSNTILVFGGLKTSFSDVAGRDKPVNESEAVLLWDLREKNCTKLEASKSAQCYGSNVHFISENQFFNIGGISTYDGLANGIELFDLRQTKQSYEKFSVPMTEGEPMILINTTTCHLKSERKIITLGGGGNYFTFGTCFNKYHLVIEY